MAQMEFQLSEEQKIFRDSIRKFAQSNLADGALARANADEFPWDIARLLAQNGFFGITMPVEEGGQGGDLMDAVIAIEQIALACPRSADLMQSGNFGAIRTLAEYATHDQKERFLPDLLSGHRIIAVGMTEPEAGSAVTDLKTTAKPDGKGFRITGSKIFTSHSAAATIFLLYVRFGPGADGIGSVLVERDTPGFTLGKPSRFMSGDIWRQLYLEDCYIPPENVLLPAGGFKKQIAGFNAERIGNTARALAVGRHAYNVAREYALTRKQFNRLLCEFQGIQWKFAEMALKLEAAQLLLYRAAVNAADGLPSAYETAIAKASCNRAGFEVANESMQVLGGLGFSDECIVEYCLRRTRGWMIAGGSIEIMLNRIAENVFDRRFSQRTALAAE